ncbi:hypothetical protein M885DRAFT_627304 [Pelagophyceae sp. CCMP2097]|nr:hypothetical protein M885DRAFT_627304 [Pelagophyceae sp. CCMP2097]
MMVLGSNSMADMLRCDRIFALAPQSPEITVDMIYIDTGATDHVFGNCKGAVHIAPATNSNRVTCFDAGGNAHATQSIMTYQGIPVDTDRPICVENVHVMPSVNQIKIFSVRRLIEKGTAAIFDSHPRLVTADGTVYPLTKWEGLFVLFITSANRVLTGLEKGLSVEHGQATPTPFAHPLLGVGRCAALVLARAPCSTLATRRRVVSRLYMAARERGARSTAPVGGAPPVGPDDLYYLERLLGAADDTAGADTILDISGILAVEARVLFDPMQPDAYGARRPVRGLRSR